MQKCFSMGRVKWLFIWFLLRWGQSYFLLFIFWFPSLLENKVFYLFIEGVKPLTSVSIFKPLRSAERTPQKQNYNFLHHQIQVHKKSWQALPDQGKFRRILADKRKALNFREIIFLITEPARKNIIWIYSLKFLWVCPYQDLQRIRLFSWLFEVPECLFSRQSDVQLLPLFLLYKNVNFIKRIKQIRIIALGIIYSLLR